jgi:hypothetical protein
VSKKRSRKHAIAGLREACRIRRPATVAEGVPSRRSAPFERAGSGGTGRSLFASRGMSWAPRAAADHARAARAGERAARRLSGRGTAPRATNALKQRDEFPRHLGRRCSTRSPARGGARRGAWRPRSVSFRQAVRRASRALASVALGLAVKAVRHVPASGRGAGARTLRLAGQATAAGSGEVAEPGERRPSPIELRSPRRGTPRIMRRCRNHR